MLNLSERRLKNGILLCNFSKEGEKFGCFLLLHTFGVFQNIKVMGYLSFC